MTTKAAETRQKRLPVCGKNPVHELGGVAMRSREDVRVKARSRLQPDEFRHHDVYQVLAYCTAANVARGFLIYPVHEIAPQDEVRVRHSQIQIRQVSFNLSGSAEELRCACDELANVVFAWME